jgi:hypothetical protein
MDIFAAAFTFFLVIFGLQYFLWRVVPRWLMAAIDVLALSVLVASSLYWIGFDAGLRALPACDPNVVHIACIQGNIGKGAVGGFLVSVIPALLWTAACVPFVVRQLWHSLSQKTGPLDINAPTT